MRWFYRRIDVEGMDHLPRNAPLLIVVNHPNALVDALLVGWVMPRRIVLTAKGGALKTMLRWRPEPATRPTQRPRRSGNHFMATPTQAL